MTGEPKADQVPPLPPSARGDAAAQEKIRKLATHVGVGIHKQFVAPPGDNKTERPKDEVTFDAGWSDKAALRDQISRGPEYWKLDRVEVRVFDLSKNTDLTEYGRLLTTTSLPDASVVMVSNERQWNATSGNWMACVELQYILYRRVLITEKNKHEQASGD